MKFDTRLLTSLNVLVAVVNAGSFVRAAQVIGLTQSGVSRAIQSLERHLGAQLLDRTSQRIILTDEGQRFYREVLPLLEGLEIAASEITHSAGKVRGHLKINVDPTFARLVLAPKLGVFLKIHPDLEMEIIVRDRMGDLVGEGFDLALRFGEAETNALSRIPILTSRVLTCASPSYLKKHGLPREPKDLGNGRHECILFRDPASGRPFSWEFHQGKKVITVPVHGSLVVNDGAVQLALCQGGYGIAQIFDLGIASLLKKRALVQLFPDWSDEQFPLFALYPSKKTLTAKVRAFLDFIAEV